MTNEMILTFQLSIFHFAAVNKLIIDTRIEILYLRHTRVSSTKDSSVTLEQKKC